MTSGLRVLVIGSPGRTSFELIRSAAAAGHEVSYFVERGTLDAATRELVTRRFRGHLRDGDAVARAVRGHHGVLVALDRGDGEHGHSAMSWAMANIVRATQRTGCHRLVVQSPTGVSAGDSRREQLLRLETSYRGWVLVQTAPLVDGGATHAYRAGTDLPLKPTSQITHADVAEFMVAQIESHQWVHKAVRLDGPTQARLGTAA